MRREERQEEGGSHVGHVLPAVPSQVAAAEAERVADSGEGEKRAEHSARSVSGNDETEDDAASAVNWASVEEMAVGESCLEQGRCDGKENQEDHLAERKGPHGERRLSLKAKSEQETSAATCSERWNKKGDEDDARHGREALQFTGDKTPSSPVEQHMSKKTSEGEVHRTVQSQLVATAVRTCATTWRRVAAARRGGKPTWPHGDEAERGRWRLTCWRRRREQHRQTSWSPVSSSSTSGQRHPNLRTALHRKLSRCRQASAAGGIAGVATPRLPTAASSPCRSGHRARALTRRPTRSVLNAAPRRRDATSQGAKETELQEANTRRRRQSNAQASSWRQATWTQTAISTDRWVYSVTSPPSRVFRSALISEAPKN
ncbi:hypothetical protein HPB51_008674 [Rhipicephalus microplus]|uniref:Uncharacterized protein n=1 Tax=Rhipicephalus microplus TaxID=6941 RepID=A0A9J6E8B0_RHIMP|nr:hypothetical protein HPB51_008674 [Rhipicephalus microplus]